MGTISRRLTGAGVLILALALSACGFAGPLTPANGSAPGPAQEQSSDQRMVTSKLEGEVNGIPFVQETHVDKDGSERIVVTTGEEEWRFTLVDGELSEEDLIRMRYLTLSAYGYYSTRAPAGLDGKRGLAERTSNHDFTDCYARPYGVACFWDIAFGYEDDVYMLDTDKEDRRVVPLLFDDEDQTIFADFWVASTALAPPNGPDEEYVTTRYGEFGTSPTRDELYDYGLDGLPFPDLSL